MYGVNNDDDKIDDNLEIINNTNDIDNTKIKNDYDCDHDNDHNHNASNILPNRCWVNCLEFLMGA